MRKNAILVWAVLLAGLWIQGCQEKPVKVEKNVQYVSGADEVTYLKLGKEISETVGAMLKSDLSKAMKEGGPVNAVKFCNAHALNITDSFSKKYGTEVKRVSDRNRNELNSPDEIETRVLADFKEALKSGEMISARIAIDQDGRKNFYAPIIAGSVCLTCHGAAADLQPELTTIIDSLYPNDRAKGYVENELRGIWSIKFKNS